MSAVAIIGSGPAGLYVADALSRAAPGSQIDIIECLPFPFGLIRYGVAPDHETTWNVTQVLGRIFSRPGIRFHGNIEVGRDITLAELQSRFDAVVIATGARGGRRLDIIERDHARCFTAYDLARWFNGHPNLNDIDPPADVRSVCIIGNGNVSLDMARILAKTQDELASFDVSDRALDWLGRLDLREIHIIGRRGAGETRFASAELAELKRLARFQPMVSDAALQGSEVKNEAALSVLQDFSRHPLAREKRPLQFHFNATPMRYRDGTLEVSKPDGSDRIPADLVIFAIGQLPSSPDGLPVDPGSGTIRHQDGLVAEAGNVFVIGWAAGGEGAIPQARAAAALLAPKIVALLGASQHSSQAADMLDLCREKGLRPVSWQNWQRIDRHEIEAGALQGKRRRKIIEGQTLAVIR